MLLLGFFVALGMSLSAAQAGSGAVMMMPSGDHMAATSYSHCDGCKDMPGTAKLMACDAACTVVLVATMPSIPGLCLDSPLDRPQFQAVDWSAWTDSPTPHPPKLISAI